MNLRVRYVLICMFVFASPPAYAEQPPITGIAFSPDGQSVVAASQAGVVIYDWPELKQQRRIQTSIANVNDVTFAPEGKRLAIAGGRPSEKGAVEIVSWPDGEPLQRIDEHADSVMAVQWIDETSVATGSLDNRVLICDASSGNVEKSLDGHSRGVTTLCVLPDKTLVTAGIDQSLRVWNVDSGELKRSLSIHTQPIHWLTLRPKADRLPMLASVSDDRTVRFWQPTIGRMVRFAKLKSKPICSAWLSDGSQVVVGCTNGHVYFIDLDTVEVVRDVSPIDGWVYSMDVHPTEQHIVVGGSGSQLQAIEFNQ